MTFTGLALERYLARLDAAAPAAERAARRLRETSDPDEVDALLASAGVEVLFLNWKPVFRRGVRRLLRGRASGGGGLGAGAVEHVALVSVEGVSLGTLRPSENGSLCVFSHFSRVAAPSFADLAAHARAWVARGIAQRSSMVWFAYPHALHDDMVRARLDLDPRKQELLFVYDVDRARRRSSGAAS